jgi:hypothetical protein
VETAEPTKLKSTASATTQHTIRSRAYLYRRLACPWTVQGEKADAAIEKRCVRLGQIFLPTMETTDCEDDRYRAFHRRENVDQRLTL